MISAPKVGFEAYGPRLAPQSQVFNLANTAWDFAIFAPVFALPKPVLLIMIAKVVTTVTTQAAMLPMLCHRRALCFVIQLVSHLSAEFGLSRDNYVELEIP